MQQIFPLVLVFTILWACGSGGSSVVARLEKLEAELTGIPHKETLVELLDLYQNAAEISDGEARMEYYWKGAETARSLREFDLAERMLTYLYEHEPDSRYAVKALFLHAFMADEDMSDIEKARALYTEFIKRYPDADFASNAEFLLEHLGKSNEEILQMLGSKEDDTQ